LSYILNRCVQNELITTGHHKRQTPLFLQPFSMIIDCGNQCSHFASSLVYSCICCCNIF